jgi:ubiquinone/menaquinone biosynthesis C-methylase UbiE
MAAISGDLLAVYVFPLYKVSAYQTGGCTLADDLAKGRFPAFSLFELRPPVPEFSVANQRWVGYNGGAGRLLPLVAKQFLQRLMPCFKKARMYKSRWVNPVTNNPGSRPILILPQRKNVFKTERGDPVYHHYNMLTGWMYKKRLRMTLSLLPGDIEKVLDVGYGSGILFPSLLNKAAHCHGLEIHGKEQNILEMLEKEGVDTDRITLHSGSILEMPYPDGVFDAVVSVSTLEHMLPPAQLDKAVSEVGRVLKKNGRAVLSFPVRNAVTDWFYRAVGFKPRDIHPAGHADIMQAARKHFTVETILKFPNFRNINLSLYCSLQCLKK